MNNKEKIELARDWYNDQSTTNKEKLLLEKLFPEIIESKDERIRKELLKHCINRRDGKQVCVDASDYRRWADWLEKQGEQKPANIEPKFHKGDMIIHKELGGDYIHNPHKIIQVDILDKEYRLEGGLVAHFSEEDDYELVKQNPAWSDDDEKMMQFILKYINASASNFDFGNIQIWFRNIKKRMKGE